jgi:large subunit ribosomal protein L9
MKAILIREVKDLGKVGDVVNVADGYARNYLIPRKLVIEATNGSLKALDQQHALEGKKDVKKLEDAQGLAAKIQELSVVIVGKTGQGTRLYGSVTAQDIADALKAQHKLEIDKRKVDIIEPIKSLGSYSVAIRLARTVTATLQLEVTSENAPAPKPAEKPKAKPKAEASVVEEAPVAEAAVVEEPVEEVVVGAEAAVVEEQTEEAEKTEESEG